MLLTLRRIAVLASAPAGRVREGAKLLERAAQQAGHLHLGDADTLGDLRLGQVLDEAQLQDQALARGEVASAALTVASSSTSS